MSKNRCLHCELWDVLANYCRDIGPSTKDVLSAVANLAANVILTDANGDHGRRRELEAEMDALTREHVRTIALRQYQETRAGRA